MTSPREQALAKQLRDLRRERRSEAKRARTASPKARARDAGFLHWLHVDMPCIACEVEGFAWRRLSGSWGSVVSYYPIEAAHQKHIAGRGGMLGKRPDDLGHTVPLCAWHHRLAPNACDPAQRKFWARIGVDVAAFCAALADAYRNGEPGAEVVKRFAEDHATMERA